MQEAQEVQRTPSAAATIQHDAASVSQNGIILRAVFQDSLAAQL